LLKRLKTSRLCEIRRELEGAIRLEGVTEKLQVDEEGDPDPVRRSDKYYRLEP